MRFGHREIVRTSSQCALVVRGADETIEDGMYLRAAHDTGRRHGLALPWNLPEVPVLPEGLVGVGIASQQGGEGLRLAHFCAARVVQDFVHKARTELAS